MNRSRPGRGPRSPERVGYGRPPKQHQFKKGASGNPMGRPRKEPESVPELVARLLRTKHQTLEGKKSARDLIVMRALRDVLSGKRKAADVWADIELVEYYDSQSRSRTPDEIRERKRFLAEQFGEARTKVSLSHGDIYLGHFHDLALRLFDWMHYAPKLFSCAQWAPVSDLLQQVVLGTTRRVVINLPPQSLKTFLCTISLPIATLLHNPAARILILVRSKANIDELRTHYRRMTQLPPDLPDEIRLMEEAGSFHTFAGGEIRILAFDDEVAGNGFNLCVVDDPQTLGPVRNPVLRQAAHDRFKSNVIARLGPDGAAVLVQSRQHTDDLTGRLSAANIPFTGGAAGWHKFAHAAAWQPAHMILNSGAAPSVLSPEHLPPNRVVELMRELPPAEFSALWMQAPVDGDVPHMIEACRRVVGRAGAKYAQESQEMPVALAELLAYDVLGIAGNWIRPLHHPARLTTEQRSQNLLKLADLRHRLDTRRISQAEYDNASWPLL